jgi:SpoVK/Ycf46/Vps4 family AAA+-type ATPase
VSQRFNNTPSIDQLIIGKITMSTKIHIKMKQDISMYSLPNLSEVGGLKEQIKELQTLVIKPFNQPDRYITELGVIFPKGILLYGTSGTGKTLLAEAIINELDDAVHKVIINEEMMLKESAYLDGVLSEARDHSPSVILINDIDEICPYGKDLPLTDVQLNNFITLRKHFDLLSKSPLVPHNVVIATTNDLNSVHTRLKLPGRFDKEVELTTPTSIDRRAILMIMLKEIHHDLSEEDINNIALESHGRVGADLKKICQVAQHIALKREDDKNAFSVDRETFKEALKIIQPSVMREIWIEVPQVSSIKYNT